MEDMATDNQLYERLSQRLHENDICEFCRMVQGRKHNSLREKLLHLAGDVNDRVRYNALWVLTHFPTAENEWLCRSQNMLVDMAMAEKHSGCLRLWLTVLNNQSFAADNCRTDFFDFCLNLVMDCHQVVSVRSMAVKLAYKMGRCHPEMLAEIRLVVEEVRWGMTQPALKSAIRVGERAVADLSTDC